LQILEISSEIKGFFFTNIFKKKKKRVLWERAEQRPENDDRP
jgi:hypothetical protein